MGCIRSSEDSGADRGIYPVQEPRRGTSRNRPRPSGGHHRDTRRCRKTSEQASAMAIGVHHQWAKKTPKNDSSNGTASASTMNRSASPPTTSCPSAEPLIRPGMLFTFPLPALSSLIADHCLRGLEALGVRVDRSKGSSAIDLARISVRLTPFATASTPSCSSTPTSSSTPSTPCPCCGHPSR